jgi:CRISPR-associated endonuclease Csn1
MRYRLALDLGTASVGLVAYELNDDDAPVGIAYHAVRVFDEPVMPSKSSSVGEPKKAARRLARQQRRQHGRRARRLRGLAQVLRDALSLDLTAIPPDPGQRIHALRSAAAHGRVELPHLFNVLMHLAKRRGYSGGFRDTDADEDAGVVQSGISQLRAEMAEHGCTTLGDYLHWRAGKGQTLRLKNAGLYADRKLVRDEFEHIWLEQAKYHAVIAKGGATLREQVAERIFHQRPLRSPAPLVGNCPLEPSLRRSPMAQPAAQAFRIEKQIADLRWTNGRWSSPLSAEQKSIVRELLEQHPQQTFTQIYHEFQRRDCPRPSIGWLNLDRSSRDTVTGNRTVAAMARLGLAEAWAALDPGHQITVINLLADIGSPEVLSRAGWHEQLLTGGKEPRRRVLHEAVVRFIDALAAKPKFGRLTAMGFDSGRSAYSIKALRRLTAVMYEQGCDEHAAIAQCYPSRHEQRQAPGPELPPPLQTGNTVVDVALRQVRCAVNVAIRALGTTPAQVIIELSRDMALGITRRREIEGRIDKNRRARQKAAAAIAAHGGDVTQSAIRRYLLWQEQDEQWCPYCDRPINLADALDGSVTHYEHIYPKSLTRIGKQRDFLVLAHRECNDAKGSRTPWQAWGQGQDPERWRSVQQRAARFKETKRYGKAKQLLAEETADRAIDDDVIKDFSARQFHESSWIAKEAASWLRTICTDVMVSRGMLTAHLRRNWGLETVIPEARLAEGLRLKDTDGNEIASDDFDLYRRYWNGDKSGARTDRELDKRIDHRHHLIDALVIGLCDRRLYQRMARDFKQAMERGEARLSLVTKPPLRDLRTVARHLVDHCNLTRKPDRFVSGNFFKGTAYGRTADGTHLLLRKAVSELGGGAKATLDKVRKDIANIAHDSTRDLVQQTFERRIAAGLSPARAITDPIEHPAYGTVLKRVLLMDQRAQDAKMVTHGKRNPNLSKHLKPDGYACLELFSGEDGSPKTSLLPHHVAHTTLARCGSRRYFKGDMVRDPKDGAIFVVGQIKAEDNGSLMLARVTETAKIEQLKGTKGFRKVSGRQIARLEVLTDVCSSRTAH